MFIYLIFCLSPCLLINCIDVLICSTHRSSSLLSMLLSLFVLECSFFFLPVDQIISVAPFLESRPNSISKDTCY
uniref:Uncharacterized protein n=1 Tax=Rhizophora mucronata TaxID=61149 RepID=A0A2P2MYY5_RHIMU